MAREALKGPDFSVPPAPRGFRGDTIERIDSTPSRVAKKTISRPKKFLIGVLFAAGVGGPVAYAATQREDSPAPVSPPAITHDEEFATKYPGITIPPNISPYVARPDGGYVNANGGQDVFPTPVVTPEPGPSK